MIQMVVAKCPIFQTLEGIKKISDLIGQNNNQAAIIQALDNCLLSDDELLAGKALWQTLPDPFPVWEEA